MTAKTPGARSAKPGCARFLFWSCFALLFRASQAAPDRREGVIEVKGRTREPREVTPAQKKPPAGCPAGGRQLKLVTRASRNDVAVDADAQSVVVLIRDAIDRGRLGCVDQGGIGHIGVLRCRLQLLVDHIEAHIEPRCEVVLCPGTGRPVAEVVAALP